MESTKILKRHLIMGEEARKVEIMEEIMENVKMEMERGQKIVNPR